MFTMENGIQLQKKILQQLQTSAGDVLDKTKTCYTKDDDLQLNVLLKE